MSTQENTATEKPDVHHQVADAIEHKPYNYDTPDWAPLERAVMASGLERKVCAEFMWMCEEPAGVHQYKHRDTRSYVRLRIDTSAPACKRDVIAARGGRS